MPTQGADTRAGAGWAGNLTWESVLKPVLTAARRAKSSTLTDSKMASS